MSTRPHPLSRIAPLASALLGASLFVMGCSAGPESGSSELYDSLSEAASPGSVEAAMTSSCTTSSIKALSQQIIDEAKCLDDDAFVKVPKEGKVSFGSVVFQYLEKPAKDKVVAALKASPSRSMTVNSMLRTVGQQYLLYRWYQTGRCGIGLAAKPGSSNHETGLALDISEYSSWKSSLQSRGFKWLGSSDPVHFDYAGSGAVSHKGLDVKAFQRLWNRNHTNDKITTDGIWGPQTEARMKKSPAAGFAKGARCGSSSQSYESEAEIASDDEQTSGPPGQGAAFGSEAEHEHDLDLMESGIHFVDDALGEASIETSEDDAEERARCASCFQAICDADAYCCETDWDDRCVEEGTVICDSLCGPDAD